MAACFESSLPGRCEKATCRSGLVSETRWLGSGFVVQGRWVLVGEFCSVPTSSEPFSTTSNAWKLILFSKRWVKIGALCLFPVDASWLSLQLDATRKRRVLGKTYISFLSFVLAQKSVFLVQTLPALRFGTLNVGVVNGVSEVMAGQHLNSWESWGEDNTYVINCRWNLLFSFPSPTLLPLIKTPLEGVWQVGTPLGYSGSQNPQGQVVAEGCFLSQPCNPELLSVTGEPPRGTLHICNVRVLRHHSVLLNGDRQPPHHPLREGEQQ